MDDIDVNMSTPAGVSEVVYTVISNFTLHDVEQITDSTPFTDLDIDSLTLMEVVMDCEDELGVSLMIDFETEKVSTVGELIKQISRIINENQKPIL
jgi:acyl carrier protein